MYGTKSGCEMIVENLLENYSCIFWDFDGVIKDSVEVKSLAYEQLFLEYGSDLIYKVRQHHQRNGGVSRFEKIPLYLHWAGVEHSDSIVDEFCQKFSENVVASVVGSDWVPGVLEFLKRHHAEKRFFLVTATPTNEIKDILNQLELAGIFSDVFGAPIEKDVIVKDIIHKENLDPSCCCFVGDSKSDYTAASVNNIDFILRCTSLNVELQAVHKGASFRELNNR